MEIEQILKNNHIPTSEIKQDIIDTKEEVKDFNDEKDVLMRNPVDNKVRIYFLEGHISKGIKFIKQLNEILEYRIQND